MKLSKIYIGKNATYRSDKSIQEMLYAMSDLIEDRILDDLKKSNFFALMFDETTDCSVIEQLVIRTRCIDSNATNIANQVKDFVMSKQLMFSKLVGIGTDGAPVMTGKHNGAVKQIIDFQKEAQTNSDPGRKWHTLCCPQA